MPYSYAINDKEILLICQEIRPKVIHRLDFLPKGSVNADMMDDLRELPLDDLRAMWTKTWGKPPHGTMGRTMMAESMKFKQREQETGGLKSKEQERLDELVQRYKHNPNSFDKAIQLKPGTRLVRTWKGRKHCVTVIRDGFEYEGEIYASLSHIANTITGSRWNGWLFFALKKEEKP